MAEVLSLNCVDANNISTIFVKNSKIANVAEPSAVQSADINF